MRILLTNENALPRAVDIPLPDGTAVRQTVQPSGQINIGDRVSPYVANRISAVRNLLTQGFSVAIEAEDGDFVGLPSSGGVAAAGSPGDLLVSQGDTASPTYAPLGGGPGVAGQVLTALGGGAYNWQAVPAVGGVPHTVAGAANPILVDGSANPYLGVDDTAKVMTFGDAAINPTFTFVGAGDVQISGSAGTSGQVWTSNGAGAAPSYQTPTVPAHQHPGSGSNSLQIGTSGVASATGAVALGTAAQAQATGSIAIGRSSTVGAGDTQGIAIGNQSIANLRGLSIGWATFSSDDALAVGYQAASINNRGCSFGVRASSRAVGVSVGYETGIFGSQSGTVLIGYQASGSGTSAIAIGQSAIANGLAAVALGPSASAAHANSVAIGVNALTTAVNQCIVGSGGTPLDLTITGALDHDGPTLGVFGTAPAPQQAVMGSRAGNAALASLLTVLASHGLIINSTIP